MTTKKIFFFATLAILGAGISIAGTSLAAGVDITSKLVNVGTAAGFQNQTPNIATMVGLIIQAILSLIGIIFMAYIFYAGYLWMTAQGKEETLQKAKSILRGSIIGIIIILAAYAITSFVVTKLETATSYQPAQTSGSTTPAGGQ